MWRILAANVEILVHRGHLYVPLLRDPDIDREIQASISPSQASPTSPDGFTRSSPLPVVFSCQDKLFVQAVGASSLVENYAKIFPQAFEDRRRALRERYSLAADFYGVNLDPHLVTIVFHILPHFLRREGFQKRRRLKEGEILDLIRARLSIPYHFEQEARRFLDTQPLEEALVRLETAPVEAQPPPEGLMSSATLLKWWEKAVTARVLAQERRRLAQELKDRERWAAAHEGRLAVLLYLAAKGSLELDGFGFTRLKKTSGYRIYKHTGPYVLQDFYGRLYFFPDCRVAVTTLGRLRPVVVDHYKHPFLRRHGPGQQICMGPENQNLFFSAANAIRVLEEGINTLLYSYDTRRRRGYHRLDVLPGMMRLVDFEDYRIAPDHPLLVSGQVEVKNRTA
jgi:hypothetical protein